MAGSSVKSALSTVTPRPSSKFSTSTAKKKMPAMFKLPAVTIDLDDDGLKVGDISGIGLIKSPPSRRLYFREKQAAAALRAKEDKKYRTQISVLESKLRRQETELTSSKALVNTLKAQIQEKDQHTRDLELRLPKVLADISKGIGSKETLARKTLKSSQESMRRNHQLSAKVKELEAKLSKREASEKQLRVVNSSLTAANDKLRAEVRKKEAAVREMAASSETSSAELGRVKDENRALIQQKTVLMEEKSVLLEEKTVLAQEKKVLIQERADLILKCANLQTENRQLQETLCTKEKEFSQKMTELENENDYMYKEVSEQYDQLLKTETELKNLETTVLNLLRNCSALRVSSIESPSKPTDGNLENLDGLKNQEPLSPWCFQKSTGRLSNLTWPPDAKRVNRNLFNASADLSGILYPIDSHYFEHDSVGDLHGSSGDLQDSREDLHDLEEDWEGLEDGELDESSTDEFENSLERSTFFSRIENLDLKLELLLNRLNNTISTIPSRT